MLATTTGGTTMATFNTTLLQNGNNVGIDVPEEVVLGFGAGKRVPVNVTVNGYTWRSTIAVMGGKYLVGIPKAQREAAGVAGGETHASTRWPTPTARSTSGRSRRPRPTRPASGGSPRRSRS
jgi:hypothetical protein